MKIKGFTYTGDAKYKFNEFLECDLVIERNEIVEFKNGLDVTLYPREYNSELSLITKIYKSYKSKERIPKGCKYYIQYSTKKGLTNIYLDISKTQYWILKWQLKQYLIQSKEIYLDVIKYLIVSAIGFAGGYVYQKNNVDNQKPNNPDNIQSKASTITNNNLVSKDTLRVNLKDIN